MIRRWTWCAGVALAAIAAGGAASCGGSDGTELTSGSGKSGDGGGSSAGQGSGGEGSGGGSVGSGGGPDSASGSGGASGPCQPGETKSCYSGPAGTKGVGLCTEGTTTCKDDGSGFGPCEGDVTPVEETCATRGDDDCDGETNEEGEGCECEPGTKTSCYSGPPETEDVGACKPGKQTCNDDGTGWGPCEGEVTPTDETCESNADEDCDGKINEEGEGCVCVPGATAPCYSGPADTQGVGTCMAGTKQCNGQGTGYGICIGEVKPKQESCENNLDDDCNGLVNDGCACQPGSVVACYAGPAGTQNVGICKAGTQTCNAQGTGYGACTGQVLPQQEACGNAKDDDCDDQVDEGCFCQPGATSGCYSGPAGTANVGICKVGTKTCNAQGSGYGPCIGEVLPSAEACGNGKDDDCDGQVDEGCASCQPGSTKACYSGPAGTQGVGICKAGTQTCNAQGTGYGACVGEVLPQAENCATPADENCDGQSPVCNDQPIIDLRADVNRNGTVDLADPTEDANEHTWDKTHGAVLLANIDDDQQTCPTQNQSDAQLAACNDAADSVINGADDLADLARLKTVPWPSAPNDAKASITLSQPGASYVRLFKNTGGTFQVLTPNQYSITAAELKAGVELAIEAKDIVRDKAVWDGFVDVTLNVDAGTGKGGPLPDGSDTVRMRVAPVLFRHHLDPATTIYASKLNTQSSTVFLNDLGAATSGAGVPGGLVTFSVNDQWNQDYFETAYMSMPAPGGGQKVIHVNFRSANYTGNGLRSAGKVVFTVLRGKDVAGAVQYDPNHANYMDTLNSFGNLETIPPHTHGGQSWPLGRVLRGSTPTFYPDKSFDKMITAQGQQSIVYIDTEWLLVAHVDETTSFFKANSPRGWAMMANDPTLAKNMLEAAKNAGFGNTKMFVGKFWSGGASAEVTINQVLADPDVMNESAWSAAEVDGQLDVIKQATGITDAEIVPVPFLHEEASGYSLAYQPGTVNGIYLANGHFGSPRPHGPKIGGVDIFEDQLVEALAPYGIKVWWIEDWDLYHRLSGEVHCGSNTTRAVPSNVKWWESGL